LRPRRATRYLVLFAAAAVACPAPVAAAGDRCADGSTTPAQLSTAAADHALRCLVNRVRHRHGLRPVRTERHLRRAAQRHADDMAERDFFAHISPGGTTLQARVRRSGYLRRAHAWWLGEALAWGRGDTGRPSSIVRSLLASPAHRALLLDPGFRDLGIGVARGTPHGAGAGALTVTLDFGRRRR
jgi:uncharacterized protein YkwD